MTRMNMTRLCTAVAALSTALLLSTGIGQAAEKPQEELSSAVIMPDTARTVFQVQKNGKWGAVAADGTEVVPLVYDTASSPMRRVISSSRRTADWASSVRMEPRSSPRPT